MARIKESLLRDEEQQRQAATLGELAAQGLRVFCWCNRCGHNATLDSARLIAELGPQFPVPEVGGKLRCTGCDGKDIATRPAWPGLGTVTRHAGPVADQEDTVATDENADEPEQEPAPPSS